MLPGMRISFSSKACPFILSGYKIKDIGFWIELNHYFAKRRQWLCKHKFLHTWPNFDTPVCIHWSPHLSWRILREFWLTQYQTITIRSIVLRTCLDFVNELKQGSCQNPVGGGHWMQLKFYPVSRNFSRNPYDGVFTFILLSQFFN